MITTLVSILVYLFVGVGTYCTMLPQEVSDTRGISGFLNLSLLWPIHMVGAIVLAIEDKW